MDSASAIFHIFALRLARVGLHEAVSVARRLHVIVGDNGDRLLARDDATVFSPRLFELLPQHPILTVNRGYNDNGTIKTPDEYTKYAEGFVIIRSTGRPVRLDNTHDQANLTN